MAKHPSFDPDVKVSLHPALGLRPNYGKQVISVPYTWIQKTLRDSFGYDNVYEVPVN